MGRVSAMAETAKLKLSGKDNYGNPRQEWADKLAAMDDGDLAGTCERAIWLSAYAGNNPRSDYHWQADACHDHCRLIGRPEVYSLAWKRAAGQP